MIKKVLACFLFFLCLSSLLPVFAQSSAKYEIPEATDGQINEALEKIVPLRFLPGHPLYFLIKVKENFNSFFQPSSAKVAQFQAVLSGKRLKETYRLILEGKNSEAFANLNRYQSTNKRVIDKLSKAIGQNQEVTPLVEEIAEDLKSQEVVLYAIFSHDEHLLDNKDFKSSFDSSVESFVQVAMAVNGIKPGLKDRFKTVTSWESTKSQELIEASGSATPEPRLFEATASVRPKRVIY